MMEKNQLERISKLKSPYSRLHDAIKCMMKHRDKVAVELAKNLREDLSNFENNEKHETTEVKNQFRASFLCALHSKDDYFSAHEDRTIQPLIHAIHKNLYATLFLNRDHVSTLSFFKEDTEEIAHKPFSPLL